MPMGIEGIMRCVLHRYPFLLIDRVLSYQANDKLSAMKNVTINEPFFPGHFPGQPMMPAVLLIEAMAQAAGLLYSLSNGYSYANVEGIYLVGVDKARIRSPVIPGDTLMFHVECLRERSRFMIYQAVTEVEQREVAGAQITLARQ